MPPAPKPFSRRRYLRPISGQQEAPGGRGGSREARRHGRPHEGGGSGRERGRFRLLKMSSLRSRCRMKQLAGHAQVRDGKETRRAQMCRDKGHAASSVDGDGQGGPRAHGSTPSPVTARPWERPPHPSPLVHEGVDRLPDLVSLLIVLVILPRRCQRAGIIAHELVELGVVLGVGRSTILEG